MELDSLIINSNYVVSKDAILYKSIVNVPLCYKEDDVFYIYLDLKIYKQVIKLIKLLSDKNVEFYLTSPLYSNPKEEIDNNKVIYSYLYALSKDDFFYGIEKINFDILHNLIQWMEKENCHNLFMDNYNEIMKRVNASWYDYYNQTKVYKCDITIREYFSNLLREIQINRILL